MNTTPSTSSIILKTSAKTYFDLGYRAAAALNKNDQALHNHFHTHFLKARRLELDHHKQQAENHYDAGYKDARGTPTLSYF